MLKHFDFSILIPNYGFSQYIFDCLDSVTTQITNDLFDYEIIMCDQSLEEDYLLIKQEINKRYGKKVNLIHSDIKGLFKARHQLMRFSSGDYIVFIDSDDTIESDYLSTLYNIILDEGQPDVIIIPFVLCTEKCEPIKEQLIFPDDIDFHVLDYFLCTNMLNSACVKPFKKELYDFNDYEGFNFEITQGEDFAFTYPILEKATNISSHFELRKYHYRMVSDSMSRKLNIQELYNGLFLKRFFLKENRLNSFQKRLFLKDRALFFSSSIQTMIAQKSIIKSQFKESLLAYIDLINHFKLQDLSKLSIKHKLIHKAAMKNRFNFLWFLFKLLAFIRRI